MQIPPNLIGEEPWDKFTKRELVAARMLERLVGENTKLERPIDAAGVRFLTTLSADLADGLFVALYPPKPNGSSKSSTAL